MSQVQKRLTPHKVIFGYEGDATKQQVKKWTEIYTYMQNKWIKSIIFGICGYLAIGCSLK